MNVRIITGVSITIAALAVTACTSTSDGLELKLEDNPREVVATRHQDQSTTAYSTEQLIHLHNEN